MELCGDEHGQNRSDTANIASDDQEFLCGDRMFVRQPFETRTDAVQVLDFVKD